MTPEGERTALERMLEARSVAVVGASAREGSVGNQSVVELIEGGFDGRIFPVNPKYDEVLGLPRVRIAGRRSASRWTS